MGNYQSSENNKNDVIVPVGNYITRSWLKKKKEYVIDNGLDKEDYYYDLEKLFFVPTQGGRNVFTLLLGTFWNKIRDCGWKNAVPNFYLLNSYFSKTSYYENDSPLILSVDKYLKILNKKGFHLEESSPSNTVSLRSCKINYELYSSKLSNIHGMLSQGNIILGVINADVDIMKRILFNYKDRYTFKMVESDNDNLSDLIAIGGIKYDKDDEEKSEIKIKFWWMGDWMWLNWAECKDILKEVWLIGIKDNV